MIYWGFELAVLMAAAGVYVYLKRYALGQLSTEAWAEAQARLQPYPTARLAAILGLLVFTWLGTSTWPEAQYLLLRLGAVGFLFLGLLGSFWLSQRLASVSTAPGFLRSYVWAELLLYLILAGWTSMPLLAHKLAMHP